MSGLMLYWGKISPYCSELFCVASFWAFFININSALYFLDFLAASVCFAFYLQLLSWYSAWLFFCWISVSLILSTSLFSFYLYIFKKKKEIPLFSLCFSSLNCMRSPKFTRFFPCTSSAYYIVSQSVMHLVCFFISFLFNVKAVYVLSLTLKTLSSITDLSIIKIRIDLSICNYWTVVI